MEHQRKNKRKFDTLYSLALATETINVISSLIMLQLHKLIRKTTI